MSLFRLFILDLQDNLISGVDLQADSDREAMEWASFVLYPERIGELWCGTRCVGRIHYSKGARSGMEGAQLLSGSPVLEDFTCNKQRLAAV